MLHFYSHPRTVAPGSPPLITWGYGLEWYNAAVQIITYRMSVHAVEWSSLCDIIVYEREEIILITSSSSSSSGGSSGSR
jgi:hypothetical protein